MFVIALLISFSIQIQGPENFYIRAEKGEQRIFVPGYDLPAQSGVPSLPMKSILIAVPGNEDVNGIHVISVEYESIEGKFSIAPMPAPAILSFPLRNKQILKDSTIYGKNAFYPSSPIEFKGVHDFSGQRVVSLIFHPFLYNPVTGALKRVKNLEIEVYTIPSKSKMVKKTALGRKFAMNLLRAVVANPRDVGGCFSLTSNGFDYLVVTTSTMAPAFDSLMRWYSRFGIRGVVRTTTWIAANYAGRDLAEKIRNYLKICYQDSGLTFVLLGGDVGQVPARVAYAMTCGAGYVADEDSIRADLYYSDLDGTWDANNNGTFGEIGDSVDLYPDVFVGRAPVRFYREAMDFVNKIIVYESPVSRDYQNKALFFAEVLWHDPFTDASRGKDMIDSLYIPPDVLITKLYETRNNESSSSVSAAINSGVNLMNHDGHGWYTVMGTGTDNMTIEDVDALSNGNRLGILYSIGCWVGAFDRDAISEHFIRNPNGGGVAFIGNSRYGWGSPGNPGYGYSDRFDAEFYDMVFERNLINIGIALAADKAIFIPYSYDENVYRWHQYQLNLLGDPLMPIWCNIPEEIQVSIPADVIPGAELRLDFANVDSGQVCLTQFDSILAVYPFYNGSVRLRIPDNITDSLNIGVYSPNHIPLVRKVGLSGNGSFVFLDTVLVVDTGAAFPDSVLSPDEAGKLVVVLMNTGSDVQPAFVLRIYTPDTSLSFTPESLGVNALLPGESDTLVLSYITGYGAPHFIPIFFVVGSDTSVVKLLFTRPILRGTSEVVNDEVTPGDTSVLVIGISNVQPVVARNVLITVNSTNSAVHLINSEIEFSAIPGNETVECSLAVFVDSSLAIGTDFRLNFMYQASGYSGEFSVDGVVGAGNYETDFENGTSGWELGQYWSIENRRSHSGQKSLYCGVVGNWSYGNSWRTSASSPYIITSFDPELKFWLWYQVATYGSDGVYVKIERGSLLDTLDFIGSGGALDSLTSFTNSWAEYTYPLSFLRVGDTVRVIFEFVSDDDDSVAEGFYFDDVQISGSVISPVPIRERVNDHRLFDVLSAGKSFEVILNRPYAGEMQVYDCSGRLFVRRHLRFNERVVKISNLRAGIYFVKIGGQTSKAIVVK